ncbi:MAG: alpha/beta hydrolase [Thermoanaerobaculales bacterium]|jgi:pimeloyl-ACP methyl ester carboxylesterase|nr:alpha/beta hydrolase [Thermoanaerobaculales bacterium]
MGNTIVRVIFTVLIIAALLVVAAVWMVWKRPLTVDAWVSRRALGIAGLEQRELAVAAGRVSYWEGGSGPPMVLLHGAGDQAGAWARVVGGLVGDHRLIIPDLPGHGSSDPAEGPIHMTQLLDGVSTVLEARCAGEPVILVGNSLGAWLGFLYALDHPERVVRLVAVNGGPIFNDNPNQVNIFPTTREEARETLRALMGPTSPPVPGYVLDDIVRRTAGGPAARFASTADELGAYLLDDRLGEIGVPVELLWGDADRLLTLDYGQRVADGLARGRLHPIAGCGHVPQRECPTAFLEALEAALAAPPAEPRPDPVAGDGSPAAAAEAG